MNNTPNPYHEAIYRFVEEGRGHGVIMATAGSGKTTTPVEVAHRLQTGTSACFLAFNTAAAKQLRDRLPAHTTARTVHALGLKTLAARVKGRRLARVHPQKTPSWSRRGYATSSRPTGSPLPPQPRRCITSGN